MRKAKGKGQTRFRRSEWSFSNLSHAYDVQHQIRINIKLILKHQNRKVLDSVKRFKDEGSTMGRNALYRKREDIQHVWSLLAVAIWSRELFVPTWLLLHPDPFQFPDILEESIRLYKRAQIDRLRQSIEKGNDLKR
jgi:hypothetical protein